jgi:histidinol dehydrogenase
MRSERLTMSGRPEALAAELRALIGAPESVQDRVAEIIAQVRAAGDQAVIAYTRRFDTEGGEPRPLIVAGDELDAAAAGLDQPVRVGLTQAIENIRRVGEAALRDDRTVAFEHHEVILRTAPVVSAAVYVPGGRAPYPSTVAMGVATARVAGVRQVAVCAPPGRDGDVDPTVLGTCRLAGAEVVYRMGGAQAVAALAYGTESVTPVDVIVGPGNLYVQEAKRQVSGQVGIDSFAGPTDLVALAGDDADPRALSLDLLAQAEHGAGSLVVAITDSPALLAALQAELAHAADTGAVVRLVETLDAEHGLALAQALAPEHLQLVGAGPERLAPRATKAGCVFVGAASGTAFGDYIAGSNHILPTNGSARFASALGPDQFVRRYTEVRIGDGAALAAAAAPIARAEGFEYHARSMEARIRDNGER